MERFWNAPAVHSESYTASVCSMGTSGFYLQCFTWLRRDRPACVPWTSSHPFGPTRTLGGRTPWWLLQTIENGRLAVLDMEGAHSAPDLRLVLAPQPAMAHPGLQVQDYDC